MILGFALGWLAHALWRRWRVWERGARALAEDLEWAREHPGLVAAAIREANPAAGAYMDLEAVARGLAEADPPDAYGLSLEVHNI